MNQFLATFYEVQYQELTYLFIPKDSVDKTTDELVQDKELVTRFEGTLISRELSTMILCFISTCSKMAPSIEENSSNSRSFDEH